MAKKFNRDNRKFDRRNNNNGKSADGYRTGRPGGGEVDKKKGGYRNPGTAGIIPKVPDTIGSGKFGASADVPSKLTFGKNTITIQPGFLNDIGVMNNMKSGTLGVGVDFAYNHTTSRVSPYANAERTSGIMAVHVTDYLGANNNEEKSPLNMAAQLNKQYIDTALGEQISFSSSDLGIYMGAVKSLWDAVYFIKRAINLSHNAKDRSNYRTRGLYRAMKIVREGHPTGNPDPSFEIAGRSPRYLETLNGLIKRINTVPVPVNMKWLVSYTEAMYSSIFQDEDSETSQFYVVVPNGFYYYDETPTSSPSDPGWDPRKEFYNGAELKWVALDTLHPDGYASIPELLAMLESMVQAVATHTNSDAMAQKVLNAHGSANTLQIPTNQISDELVPIVFDEDFLSAFENANIIPYPLLETPSYSIDAAREMIIGRPLWHCPDVTGGGDPAVDAILACVNLPLQFHKSLDQIDDHAISNALRWHPYASFIRSHTNTGGTWDYNEVDFANNFGMQVVTHVMCTNLSGADTLQDIIFTGGYSLKHFLMAVQDFKVIPIPRDMTISNNSSDSSGEHIVDFRYAARRDAEMCIVGEDVANYFWSLAEMVWDCADGQTQFAGQRNK